MLPTCIHACTWQCYGLPGDECRSHLCHCVASSALSTDGRIRLRSVAVCHHRLLTTISTSCFVARKHKYQEDGHENVNLWPSDQVARRENGWMRVLLVPGAARYMAAGPIPRRYCLFATRVMSNLQRGAAAAGNLKMGPRPDKHLNQIRAFL